MLISDIHANLPALEAVFKDVAHSFGKVDYVICAGDIVGMGPFPNEVCESLKDMEKFISVRGECDQAVIDKKLTGIDPSISESINWTIKNITKSSLSFLNSLDDYSPLKLMGFNIFIVHGSPENYLNGMISKIEPTDTLRKYLVDTNADIMICGQTHVPFVKEIDGKYIINPGSVGQPKDGNPASSYAFIDINNMEISFRRVSYDIESLIKRAKRFRFPENLLDRFYFGR